MSAKPLTIEVLLFLNDPSELEHSTVYAEIRNLLALFPL